MKAKMWERLKAIPYLQSLHLLVRRSDVDVDKVHEHLAELFHERAFISVRQDTVETVVSEARWGPFDL